MTGLSAGARGTVSVQAGGGKQANRKGCIVLFVPLGASRLGHLELHGPLLLLDLAS